jgi:hypothetical protein
LNTKKEQEEVNTFFLYHFGEERFRMFDVWKTSGRHSSIYIYEMIFIIQSINIYNKYVVIYYPRDASFHGSSPYVLYIWNTHHCNNIYTYNIISYEKSTWYQSMTGLNSLMGGPKKIREIASWSLFRGSDEVQMH